jgi:hypothetical protein
MAVKEVSRRENSSNPFKDEVDAIEDDDEDPFSGLHSTSEEE